MSGPFIEILTLAAVQVCCCCCLVLHCFSLVVMTLKYFLKFQSYNTDGPSNKLSNEDLLSEIMILSLLLKHGYLMGLILTFQVSILSQRAEQSIKKLNVTLGV